MTPRHLFSTIPLVVVLATLTLSAHAHQVGLSRGEYSLDGERVTSTLTFARAELGSTPAPAVAEALHVTAGGVPCRTEQTSTGPVAPDGVRVSLRHLCPPAGDVSLRFGFVDGFEPGHRHIAELTSRGRVTTFVAYRGNTSVAVSRSAADTSRAHGLLGFFRLGVEHVLTGWDHLAFLLGIALASFGARSVTGGSTRRRAHALLLAVTAFTAAHSITLAAGAFGLVLGSPSWVEPAIALSIAYVGVEGLVRRRPTAPYRMTFAFGLVHGMGFAGALREIAIPRSELPGALALFNVGVEGGQLVALVPVVVVLAWLVRHPAALAHAVRTVSVALACVGSVVFVTRTSASVRAAKAASASHAQQTSQMATSAPEPSYGQGVDRLCRALNELPRLRRAECEGTRPSVVLTASCTRKLESAVSSGAVSLSSDEVTACVTELARRYDTCDFTSERAAPRVAACEHVLHGTRQSGQSCRSSLECRSGLFCDGSGALDAGVCHPPRSEGDACGLSIDPLASYVQSAAPSDHRECQGDCIGYRCRAPRVATR